MSYVIEKYTDCGTEHLLVLPSFNIVPYIDMSQVISRIYMSQNYTFIFHLLYTYHTCCLQKIKCQKYGSQSTSGQTTWNGFHSATFC